MPSEKSGTSVFNRRTVIGGALAAGAALATDGMGAFAQATANAKRTPVVQTSYGPVRGYVDGGIATFKGVRYGAPTGGANRFMPPRPPQPWTEVRDALAFGDSSLQGIVPGLSAESAAAIINLQGAPPVKENFSEDCLFLNVWTPAADNRKRPVMVWLHGGGFSIGSGSGAVYDGVPLARQGDVVVITVNHRLDVLGYAQLDHLLGPAYRSSGMVGMLDLVAVLKWVRDNAAAFGGDPGNITIFGESGGGAKVSVLLAMPTAKGLFHRAIIQSGAGVRMVNKADAQGFGNALLEELGIPPADASRLINTSSEELMAAAARAVARKSATIGSRTGFSPVVDGIVLPGHPFDPAGPTVSADIPIMIGTTANESSRFFVGDPQFGKLDFSDLRQRLRVTYGERWETILDIYRRRDPKASPTDIMVDIMTQSNFLALSIELAERKLAQKRAPVWLYRLDWNSPALGGALRSPHGLDVPLVFDTTDKSTVMVGPGPEGPMVAKQMSATWIAFARTGSPNNSRIPYWPPYSMERREVMLFDVESKVVRDPDRETRLYWANA